MKRKDIYISHEETLNVNNFPHVLEITSWENLTDVEMRHQPHTDTSISL